VARCFQLYFVLQEEKDIKFKFARTRVWMYYASEISVLPPPFNLLPVDKAAMALKWLARRNQWIRKVSCRLKALNIYTKSE